MNSRLTPLAALLPCLFSAAALAQPTPGNTLTNVMVTATRLAAPTSALIADVSIIDAASIRAAGPAATLGELLGRQPGLDFRQSGGPGTVSSVSIRGSNAGHVLLLIDGVRTGSVTAGAPTWEVIPLEQVERIEIVRGPSSALYGSDAIGGVVQIFTKRGSQQAEPFLNLSYGSYRTTRLAAGISGRHEKLRYSLQAADKRSDSYNALLTSSNPSYNPDRDDYQTTSSSGSLTYNLDDSHELGASYLYADGWSRFDSGFYTPAVDYKMKKTVHGSNVYSRNRLGEHWTSTLRLGRSTDDSRNLSDGRQTDQFKSSQTDIQWQNDILLPLGMALLGVERVEQRVSSSANYSLGKRHIDSVFAGWSGQIDAHSLQANLRQDRNSQFGHKTTGLIGYGYQITPAWRTALSWGTAFKAPTFNDLYYPADNFGNVSNPKLRPETANNREISLRYETTSQQAALTYYHNKVEDLIQWAPIDPTYVTTWGWMPSNVTNATLQGWTLQYSGLWGDYRLTGSLDAMQPQNDALKKTLVNRARNLARLSVQRTFEHLTLGAEMQASGRRYMDVANSKRLGGYSIFNLHADYALSRDWSLHARADNVFDKTYALDQDFATPGASLFLGLRYAPK